MGKRGHAVYGDIFTVYVFGKRLTFVCGPKAQEQFCKSSDEDLSQQDAYKFSVPLFGEGVIYGAEPERRAEQIKLVTSSLHTTALANYVPMMLQETEAYFSKWGNEGTTDIYTALSELIILTASRCLMGHEVREQLYEEVAKLYAQLDKGCTPISFFAPHLPIPAHINRDKARNAMVKVFKKIIEDRRRDGRVEKDVLQIFMDAKFKDGTSPTVEIVTGLMICLLFAGQHTSSVTSSWTGLFLLEGARQGGPANLLPELIKEQVASGPLDHRAIRESMPLLHASLLEALRLRPPLIFLMRSAMIDIDIQGLTIPQGDTIFLSPVFSGQRSDVFSAPTEAFDPRRFLEPRNEHLKFSHGWVGFGGGRHRCLGENFAYVQIKVIWAYLLRHFELEALGPLPVPNYEALVVGPKPPCLVKYKRRAAPLA